MAGSTKDNKHELRSLSSRILDIGNKISTMVPRATIKGDLEETESDLTLPMLRSTHDQVEARVKELQLMPQKGKCNIVMYISSINTCVSGDSPLAQLVKELDLCLYMVVIRRLCLFVYLGFYVAFNTVQVISRRVVGRAEETSTYSSLGLCTVNCRPTASNYQLSHLRP